MWYMTVIAMTTIPEYIRDKQFISPHRVPMEAGIITVMEKRKCDTMRGGKSADRSVVWVVSAGVAGMLVVETLRFPNVVKQSGTFTTASLPAALTWTRYSSRVANGNDGL
jgi:hypothetical protein